MYHYYQLYDKNMYIYIILHLAIDYSENCLNRTLNVNFNVIYIHYFIYSQDAACFFSEFLLFLLKYSNHD